MSHVETSRRSLQNSASVKTMRGELPFSCRQTWAHAFVLFVISLWLLAFTHPALAEDKAASQEAYELGVEAFEKADYPTAYEAYKAAWKAENSYRNAAGLGQVELHLGRYRDAAEHLDFSLRHLPDTAIRSRRALEAGFNSALKHVALLRFDLVPETARLSINGMAVHYSKYATGVFVKPGLQTLSVAADGYQVDSQKIRTLGGSDRRVEVRLKPEAGAVVAATPEPAATEPKPAASKSIAVDSSPDTLRTAALVSGAGLALVGLGAGIALKIRSASAGSDNDDTRALISGAGGLCGVTAPHPDCERLATHAADEDDFGSWGTLALIGGSVFAGATVAGIFFWPTSDARAAEVQAAEAKATGLDSVRVLPVVSHHETGLWLNGKF